LIETARVPWLGQHRWLQVALGTYALSLVHVVKDLAASVLFLPLLGLVSEWQARGYPIRRPAGSAHWPLAALAAVIKLAASGGARRGGREARSVSGPGRYAPASLAFVALFVGLSVAVVPGVGGPATTPALRQLRERGAFNFTRADSPASGTFQSIAGYTARASRFRSRSRSGPRRGRASTAIGSRCRPSCSRRTATTRSGSVTTRRARSPRRRSASSAAFARARC
jgi:hypothetical protein